MCGIAGLCDLGRECPVAEQDVRIVASMLTTLEHRGPDDGRVWFAPGVALGNRRLSIIDPAGGRQPVHSEDGQVVAVCNGEIYNYRELAAGLRHRGHVLRSDCDT